ncbi:MAG: hypothetical protein GY866_25115 [Proteobacteria bacterium]|nr:hypothetical protein [Pseudomonadota bacterium]
MTEKHDKKYNLTILVAAKPLGKSFRLTGRKEIKKTNYELATHFGVRAECVDSIRDIWDLVQRISTDRQIAVVRGVPDFEYAEEIQANPYEKWFRSSTTGKWYLNKNVVRGDVHAPFIDAVLRRKEIFPQPENGIPWVMIDFDGVDVSASGIDPNTVDAIEYAVDEYLPEEFHGRSYVYQFSSSAGLFNEDGTPYSDGLNVHLFFHLDRNTTNEELKVWLPDIRYRNGTGTNGSTKKNR